MSLLHIHNRARYRTKIWSQNSLYHSGTERDDKQSYANTVPQMRSENYKGNVAHLNFLFYTPEGQHVMFNNQNS